MSNTENIVAMRQNIIEQVFSGEITQLEELTNIGQSAWRIAAKHRQLIALICAEALVVLKDKSRWSGYVQENFQLNASQKCHFLNVGQMIVAMRQNLKLNKFIEFYSLDFDKLLSISRIPQNARGAFLSQVSIGRLTEIDRDAVRNCVREFLGEEITIPEQLTLPGFAVALDTLATASQSSFLASITTKEQAQKGLRAGLGLLIASVNLELEAEVPDIQNLQLVRAQLFAAINELDAKLSVK